MEEISRSVHPFGEGYENNGGAIREGVDRAGFYIGALKRAITRCVVKELDTEQ